MCVSGGLVFRRAVYLTRIHNISLPLPPTPHPGFVFVQSKTYSWQSWLDMRAHLRNAPSVLYGTQSAGVRLGVVTSVIVAAGRDLPTTHHQLQ